MNLFSQHKKHELEIERLENHEDQEKKPKSLALKTKIKGYDSNKNNES